MILEIISLTLFLILGLLAIGAILHLLYLDKIYNRLLSLSGESQQFKLPLSSATSISKESLLKEIYQVHGSNFNALAISEWSLFFAAIAYFYFLTPSVFEEYNYFRVAPLASSVLGFFVFGVLVFVLTLYFSIGFSRIYGYYEITTSMKKTFTMAFFLLTVSIVCSAYTGTIYPERTAILPVAIAFITLLISQMILLAPIYIGIARVIR